MSGMSDSAETAWLRLLLQNIDWAGIGDAGGLRGSVVAGVVYIALHTADPTDAGNEGTNETSYTNYARVAVARSTAGWTVVGDTGANAAKVSFPTCGTGATQHVTHFSVGLAASGPAVIVAVGPITGGLDISQNIAPEFDVGQLQCVAA